MASSGDILGSRVTTAPPMRATVHCSLALLLLHGTTALVAAQPSTAPETGEATFAVFAAGRQVGRQEVRVAKVPEGWTITATGALAGSLALTTRKFEARYDPEWRPLGLTIDAMFKDEHFGLETTVAGTAITNRVTHARETEETTDRASPHAVLLPNNFYGAYEAVAVRLAGAVPGTRVPVYVAPQGESAIRVNEIRAERIQTAGRTITVSRHIVTIDRPGGPVEAEVWTDGGNRLVRLVLPSIEVIRSDVASVAARRQRITRAGDEQIRVPAPGFGLTGTLSKPSATSDAPLPVIVLVAGAAPRDRDEAVAGIPVFGQLANTLADAGFLVVRYDKRGVGQSGGRPEGAGIGDYAADVRAVVDYLDDREDVDDDRIVLLGHGDGGLVTLQAASRERKIAAVVLAGTPGTPGSDLVLEQQRAALDRLSLSNAEKQAKIDLQSQIHEAVTGDGSWEHIEDDVRYQADTPWFRSFLTFDHAEVVDRVRQPILILRGELDKEVPPYHADRIAELARARKRTVAVDVVGLTGLNHLLISAETGETDEYARLVGASVSAEVASEISAWLTSLWDGPAGR